jgi:hypothetical protein
MRPARAFSKLLAHVHPPRRCDWQLLAIEQLQRRREEARAEESAAHTSVSKLSAQLRTLRGEYAQLREELEAGKKHRIATVAEELRLQVLARARGWVCVCARAHLAWLTAG